MTEAQKQIEVWLDNERWKDLDIDVSEERWGSTIAALVMSVVWAFFGSLGQLAMWDFVLGWNPTENTDEAPPGFGAVLLVGFTLIVLLWGGFNLMTTYVSKKAKKLPHKLNYNQVEAVKQYGLLEKLDKDRAKTALLDFLMLNTDQVSWEYSDQRQRQWSTIYSKIEEKNRLQRELTMVNDNSEVVAQECEVLDHEIAQLRNDLSAYKELD